MSNFLSTARLLEETYVTSKDYHKLVELVKDKKTILCFYDSKINENTTIRKFDTLHSLNHLGSLYLAFNENEDEKVFIDFCESSNLSFIDPSNKHSIESVMNALHKVEVSENKNHSKLWEKLEKNL